MQNTRWKIHSGFEELKPLLFDIQAHFSESNSFIHDARNKLKIIDSTTILSQYKLSFLEELEDSILGCVTFQGRITALKYAKCLITFPSPQQTKLTQQWMALEAAASNVPVI